MSIQQLFFGGATSPYLMTATGGTITYDGKFAVHTFSASGTFTVTYKSTSGLTYQTLLAGFGADGSYGDSTDDTSGTGGNGGPGGDGGPVKSYASLPVDTGSSSAAVTIGPNYGFGTSILNWNGTYYYTSTDAGYSVAIAGAGGAGETASVAATAGSSGAAGFSSSITGSAVLYGSAGASGGGGGYSGRTGNGAAGGTGTNGAGNGGAGGSTASPDGVAAGSPTSGYGTGGSGGGGAYSDQSGIYAGGGGTNGRSGVVIIRYQYLP